MTSMRVKPCSWPLIYCGDSTPPPTDLSDISQCSSLAGIAPAMAAAIEDMAISYLWNWTKQQFGTCPITIRPCRKQCDSMWTTYRGRGGANNYLPWTEGNMGPLNPAMINGQWYNLGCGGDCNTDPCACNYVPTIDLLGPVSSVNEIRIDGIVLDPSAYRIDNYRHLIRTDGSDWPVCQDMVKNSLTDPDTFQVNYNVGVTVPLGGQVAAGILACQMAKMSCGDSTCELPQRVSSMTRQGVQIQLLDSFESMYMRGTTGLTLVDMWVSSVNAPVAKSGYRVASPDRYMTRRTTG